VEQQTGVALLRQSPYWQENNSLVTSFYLSLIWVVEFFTCTFLKLVILNPRGVTDFPFIAVSGVFFVLACMYHIAIHKFHIVKMQTLYEKLINAFGIILLVVTFASSCLLSIIVDFHVGFKGLFSLSMAIPTILILFLFQAQIFTLSQGITTSQHHILIQRNNPPSCINTLAMSCTISTIVTIPSMAGVVLMCLRLDGLLDWNMLYLCIPFLVTLFCQFGMIIQFLIDH